MTPPVPIGPSLLVVGMALTLAGAVANKYHSRRWDAHRDELRRLSEAGEWAAVTAEARKFENDKRMDMAMHIAPVEPAGWILLLAGVGWLLI